MHRITSIARMALIAGGLALAGCQSSYYGLMEQFGVEKRDLLIDRVEEANKAQEATKEQFTDALEKFSALTQFDGGELEKLYDRLKDTFEDSRSVADRVFERIEAVEQVAQDLFREWEDELDQFEDPILRDRSSEQLFQTRQSYRYLIRRMRAVEAKIDPVLQAFEDQVLFLKHNLNARAVANLDVEAERIEAQVRDLIVEMEGSIAEARTFIDQMR